ncbi:MAG TPA: hypothetical protein VIR38_12800, partial [Thalassobaculum sp.]
MSIRPFMPSSRSDAASQSRQGLMWLAISRAGLVIPVSRQARSIACTLSRYAPWPRRARIRVLRVVSSSVASATSRRSTASSISSTTARQDRLLPPPRR